MSWGFYISNLNLCTWQAEVAAEQGDDMRGGEGSRGSSLLTMTWRNIVETWSRTTLLAMASWHHQLASSREQATVATSGTDISVAGPGTWDTWETLSHSVSQSVTSSVITPPVATVHNIHQITHSCSWKYSNCCERCEVHFFQELNQTELKSLQPQSSQFKQVEHYFYIYFS